MKYTIIHINNRAKENMDHNKLILKNFDYIDDIEFFDGNMGKAQDVINHLGIKIDVWNPYDGRQSPPLPGEYGIWLSTILTWEYIVKNKVSSMLVFEDDILLDKNFVSNLNDCINELPKDYDFLSLYYFSDQNTVDEKTDFGAKNIHKSINQYSAGQAILYSYHGAKKLLKLVNRLGIEYTSDCFIFNKAQQGVVYGYSIKPDVLNFLTHDNKNIKSLIDPSNTRSTSDY